MFEGFEALDQLFNLPRLRLNLRVFFFRHRLQFLVQALDGGQSHAFLVHRGDAPVIGAVQAESGVADFTNLSLGAAGTYSLTATDGSLATAYSKSFSISPTDIWTGWISTDWNNPNNWSAVAIPGGATSVTIGGPATADSAFNIAALTLTGGTLQFAAGAGGFPV